MSEEHMNIVYIPGNFSFYFLHATLSIFLFQSDARPYPNCITVLPLKSDIMEIHYGTTV
jgi:hypothetical protein